MEAPRLQLPRGAALQAIHSVAPAPNPPAAASPTRIAPLTATAPLRLSAAAAPFPLPTDLPILEALPQVAPSPISAAAAPPRSARQSAPQADDALPLFDDLVAFDPRLGSLMSRALPGRRGHTWALSEPDAERVARKLRVAFLDRALLRQR